MGVEPIFSRDVWAAVPFHFWSLVLFTLGCIVGSFLNVVIHRLPIGESVVSPPSHCPHCKYSIPFWLNVPLVTWLWLRGKCANCCAPISPRYFLVELFTGCAFLASWLVVGRESAPLALVYCLVLAGFIASSCIDLEHMIIPDELTIGGMIAGFFCSFLVPGLQGEQSITAAMGKSFIGAAVGGGLIYGVLRVGKLLFGRQKIALGDKAKILLNETAVVLPDHEIPYEELFYRRSDTVVIRAHTVELVDRCYRDVTVRLSPEKLRIDDDEFDPELLHYLEATADEISLPREAMGFGDVKFMAAIGAFLGWQSAVFSLMASSLIGSAVGIGLILCGKKEWSSRLPYGPYIALAAVLWMFGGKEWAAWLFLR
jgi:leader peptidase (prepilin peptidase)/N-methyltransferase